MSEITMEKPDENRLRELGTGSWGAWECEPSTFPWEYEDKETCYVYEGKVTVETPEGERVDFGPGDLIIFPKGLKCTWTVHEKIRKVYKFG